MKARMFSARASSAKLALPMPPCTMARLFDAELDLPRLAARTGPPRPASPSRAWGSASARGGPGSCRAGRRRPSCPASRCSGRSRSGRPESVRPSLPRRPRPRRPPGFLSLVALGENRNPNLLAGAVGQGDHTTNHLIGVPRIDAEMNRDLDGFIELCLVAFCLTSRMASSSAYCRSVDRRPSRCCQPFSLRRHRYSTTSYAHGPRRAFHHLHRPVQVLGIEVHHLLLGNLANLLRSVTWFLHSARTTSALPFAIPAAFFNR
jgi:hypothetical protein